MLTHEYATEFEAFAYEPAYGASHEAADRVDELVESRGSRFLGNGPIGTFVVEILLAFSLLWDFVTYRYRKIPYWAIGAIAFMFLYFANPLDAIPDVIVGIGQIDDVIVVTLCFLMVRQEIHEYRRWKETQHYDDDE